MGYQGQKPDLPIGQLIAEYEGGLTGRALAKRYGVSFQAIYSRLWNAGVVPHQHRKRSGVRGDRIVLPIAELAQRYEAGESLERIGKAYGVSETTINRRLRRNGTKIRTEPRKVSDGVLRADYLGGMSVRAIARKYNIACSNVLMHLQRMGITRSYGWKMNRNKE